ncbi:hypothetical protein [Streptomyces sp. NPDC058486]|uniref:hypothetical protein n=1 Tax=unclassified Streptomyces TaxID=2593676 RepID=UPI00365DF5B8
MGLLSWLRGGGGGGGRGTDRPADTPAPVPASREDRFDVVELPAIQRTLGAPTLITDPSAFERGLPTRQPTALTTPLGHLVSAEAPSGLIQGVTTPVQRSVVDFPVRDGGRRAPTLGAAPGGEPLRPPVQRTAGAPEPTRVAFPSEPEAAGPVVNAGVQRTVAPSETSGTPGISAVPPSSGTSDTARNVGPVELPAPAAEGPAAVEPGGAAEAGEPGTVEAAAEPSVRPLVGEQPLLDLPEPDTSPGPVTEIPTHPASVPPVQRSLPPAPSASPAPRRAPGLGAPLPALPPTAQREAPGPGPGPVPLPAAAPAPVQPESPSLAPGPAPAPTPDPDPVAPLLADRPLVLRTVTPDAAPPAIGPSPEPVAAPVRWETPAVQRNHTHVPTTPTIPTPVQRTTARPAARPAERRPTPAPVQAPRNAGDVAVAAGIAQRMADGSVVFAPQPPPVQRVLPPTPFVQREVAVEEPPPPPPDDPPAVAPEPESDPVTDGPTGTDPTTAAISTPTSAAPSPGSPPVTDEFVRALYPPLARLLKAELRLERERAGRLIETRF